MAALSAKLGTDLAAVINRQFNPTRQVAPRIRESRQDRLLQ
jgi:hypothetical protein